MGIDVLAATPERWDAVQAVLGGPRARPDACWCQRLRRPAGDDHRALLAEEIADARPPVGLLALVDGTPAGWSRVVPRDALPGVRGNRALARLLPPDPGAWWVACVVVRRDLRGRGVGTALVAAAVDYADEHGAGVLEGHPVDVAAAGRRPSPAALFTGTASMFAAAGFEEVARTAPARPLVRYRFDRAATGAAPPEPQSRCS